MCYNAAQLTERIYRDALRTGASGEELLFLREKVKRLKEEFNGYYQVAGYDHPKLMAFYKNENKLDVDLFQWGLIPFWVKDEVDAKKIWNQTLNARGETIFEKPAFRDTALHKRCVVPLDGFFEHKYIREQIIPYYIRRKDQKLLLIGGLCSEWLNKETGELMKTLSIVTTQGNELLSEIHNNPKLKDSRMPLLLDDEDLEPWFNGEKEDILKLIAPNTKQELEAYTVRKLKGKTSVGNSPEAQKEFRYADLDEHLTLL